MLQRTNISDLQYSSTSLFRRGGGEVVAQRYEISNHLGNVVTIFSDRKIAKDDENNDGIIDNYKTYLFSSQDYTPFGMAMNGRGKNQVSGDYRFGFNGKEKDKETYGEGNEYDYGARIYNPRIGRWLALDPLQAKYPNLSPYNFSLNNPILYVDEKGEDVHIYISSEPIGITKLRLIGSNESNGAPKIIDVPVYVMTISDDVTGEVSTYMVTRDAPIVDNKNPININEKNEAGKTFNVNNAAFEPKNQVGKYAGVIDNDYPRGSGLPAIAFRNQQGGNKLSAEPMPGADRKDPNVAEDISIHVGGIYATPQSSTGYARTGSKGCFSLCEENQGNQGAKKLGEDIQKRIEVNKQAGAGTDIDISVEKRSDVKKEWKVNSNGENAKQ